VLQLVLHKYDNSERGRSDCRVDTGFVRSENTQYFIFCRVDTAQQLDVFTE